MEKKNKQDHYQETNIYIPKIRGRGANINPNGRFEKYEKIEVRDDGLIDEEDQGGRQIKTQVFRDTSKTVISSNDSPDIGMDATVNPYRGCEHGCIYCFARPTHEYFGLSSGLDFETKIFAKPDAPDLLRKKLESKTWEPKVITMSGVTDPYQPLEKKMKITRGCLEVLNIFKNPVAIITKNYLVTRDIDFLGELASHNAAMVNFSITTLDKELARTMEPRTSRPDMRLRGVEELSKAGIPVNVMIGPVLPGLTEHEIPHILESAARAGAVSAGYTMLRLPYAVKDLFQSWLQEHYPLKAKKILNRIREIRGGNLYDPRWGTRMRGEGFYADEISQLFRLSKKRYGLDKKLHLSAAAFNRNAYSSQFDLFGNGNND